MKGEKDDNQALSPVFSSGRQKFPPFSLDSSPRAYVNFAPRKSREGWLHSFQAIASIAHSLAQPLHSLANKSYDDE